MKPSDLLPDADKDIMPAEFDECISRVHQRVELGYDCLKQDNLPLAAFAVRAARHYLAVATLRASAPPRPTRSS